jgi:hypothetical protein
MSSMTVGSTESACGIQRQTKGRISPTTHSRSDIEFERMAPRSPYHQQQPVALSIGRGTQCADPGAELICPLLRRFPESIILLFTGLESRGWGSCNRHVGNARICCRKVPGKEQQGIPDSCPIIHRQRTRCCRTDSPPSEQLLSPYSTSDPRHWRLRPSGSLFATFPVFFVSAIHRVVASEFWAPKWVSIQ